MLSRCKRDDTRGGSHYETLRLRNHPPRDALRDPAALLTEEGIFLTSIQMDTLPSRHRAWQFDLILVSFTAMFTGRAFIYWNPLLDLAQI